MGVVHSASPNSVQALERNQSMRSVSDKATEALSSLDLRFAWDRKTVRFAPGDEEGSGGEASGDGAGEGEGSSGSGASGDGSNGDASGKTKEPVINDPEKKKLSDEAANYRTQLRAAEAAKKELADKLRQIEDKDKSDLEKAQRDLKESADKMAKLEETVTRQALEVAWVQSGASALFKNPAVAFKLLDVSKVEIKDGSADQKAVKELADVLAKSGDVVLAGGSSGEDDGNGNPSGATTNGRSSNGKNASQELLAKKFPALRSR